MSSIPNGDHIERLAEEAVEHLRLIHKYTAWSQPVSRNAS